MNIGRNALLWVLVGLLVLMLFNIFQGSATRGPQQQLTFSQFIERVDNGQVRDVSLQGQNVFGTTTEGQTFQTYVPANGFDLTQHLIDKGVAVTVVPPEEPNVFLSLLGSFGPMLLLIGVWIFFMRQMQSGGGKAMGFGKSKAQAADREAGPRHLRRRRRHRRGQGGAGGDRRVPARPAEVPAPRRQDPEGRAAGRPAGHRQDAARPRRSPARRTCRSSPSPAPTSSRCSSASAPAACATCSSRRKKNAPCIIFIDEIDAVGRHRGAGLGGGNDEREQTLNQLLVEMDGFEANEGVIIIAATNRPDVLDPALLRPGRFDRQVVVPNPDMHGREKILRVHMRKVPLAPDVDPRVIARGTPGFSGADLANLVNEAALLAARTGKRVVGMAEFEDAKDKVMMGAERRSMVMTEDEKRMTAYHEAGHALVALHVPGNDPLHKVTIIPRGRALGLTMSLPERDRYRLQEERDPGAAGDAAAASPRS